MPGPGLIGLTKKHLEIRKNIPSIRPKATPTPAVTGKSLRNQPLPGFQMPMMAPTPTPMPSGDMMGEMRSFLDNWDKLIKGLRGGK